jgi:DNA polymerase V
MIFHVDGNGFYAACEALFRPDLTGKPIAVLSNNDGITIALNQSCKDLGFKRGDQYFEMKYQYANKGVTVFSSNYTLYADICTRVNMIYNLFCPEVEMYSIDESFLFFPNWTNINWHDLGHTLRNEIDKQLHLPVSVGIAPTKTLAKMCNKLAKYRGGVCYWGDLNTDAELKKYAVEDIWGIGRSKSLLLARLNVKTAYDLKQFPLHEAKKQLTIQGFKTVQELNEICAIDRIKDPTRKNISCSKSFAHGVSTLPELETAIAEYVQLAVTRMREEGSACKFIMVYIMTARAHNEDKKNKEYFNGATAELPFSTSYLTTILEVAISLLHSLYRPQYKYRKIMINLLGLEKDITIQPDLFETETSSQREQHKAIMDACDYINTKYGRGFLHTGTRNQTKDTQGNGKKADWIMQRNLLSPKYTTNLAEIPIVY